MHKDGLKIGLGAATRIGVPPSRVVGGVLQPDSAFAGVGHVKRACLHGFFIFPSPDHALRDVLEDIGDTFASLGRGEEELWTELRRWRHWQGMWRWGWCWGGRVSATVQTRRDGLRIGHR